MNLIAIPFVFISLFAYQPEEAVHISLEGVIYDVEIADDFFEQVKGLMGRSHLDERTGMLFVYPTNRNVTFWMKNVPFPLDMIFMDQCGRVIQIYADARPDDDTLVPSIRPVRAVLELRGGASKRDQIRIGSQFDLSGLKAAGFSFTDQQDLEAVSPSTCLN